jgi:hypothetical protein
MKELGYMKEKKAMVIRCDNQGAISLTKNPMQHARTKLMKELGLGFGGG